MGMSYSRDSSHIIRINESDIGDSVGEDNEFTDVAELLNILILSGQLNIRTFYDFEEENINGEFDYPLPKVHPPRIRSPSNTTNLNKSDIKSITERSCGLTRKQLHGRPKNIVNMLNMQKNGVPRNGNFSHGDKCRISNYHIPHNFVKEIDKYPTKAFISVFSDDGNKLVTVSQDGVLHLYDSSTSNYHLIKEEKGRDIGWNILDATFTPDGNTVVFTSWSNYIHTWRINDSSSEVESAQDKLLIDVEGNRFACFSVAVSYDGINALAGANDGYIYLYDRQMEKLNLRLHAHEEDVNAVRFGTYGDDVIFSGSDDGLIKVWDRRVLHEKSPKAVGLFSGHRDGITFLDMKGDGRHFISNSKDQSIKLWDMRKFSSTKEEYRTRESLCAPEWDYRWQKIPRKLRCKTQLPDDTSIMTYRGHAVLQTLIRAKFSPAVMTGQRFIYSGCASGQVAVYDILTGKIEDTFTGHDGNVRDVSWHPYRSEIVTSSWDHSVKLWNNVPAVAVESEDEIPVKRVRRSNRIAARLCNEIETLKQDTSFRQDSAGTSGN